MPEYLAIYPELVVPEDQKQALLADRRGILIGRGLSEKYGWKIGDTFQMESTIPPYRVGRPFEFVVRAIYDVDLVRHPGTDMSQAFFHHKYLYEAARGNSYVQAGTYVVEINDPSQVAEVSQAIDALFENSHAQTKTETEGAFVASFMAVRERRTEIAVLKTLGFPGRLVLMLIIAEATMLGILGGAIGIVLGMGTIHAMMGAPFIGQLLAGFPSLGLTPAIGLEAMGVSLAIGFLAGLAPALAAYRAGITETLRTV
jgi:putative ABC transport system permease protein